MKTFHAIIGLLALVVVGVQTMRHAYVLYIEPRDSVLDQFDTVKHDIDSTESMDELLKLYADAHRKVKEADKALEESERKREDGYDYARLQREPYRSEERIRYAIQERERHQAELLELHFFWVMGAILSVVGAVVYLRVQRWAGLSVCILACLEMIWATCPAYVTFGWDLEFERLLSLKLVYSLLTLAIVLVGWIVASKKLASARQNGTKQTP